MRVQMRVLKRTIAATPKSCLFYQSQVFTLKSSESASNAHIDSVLDLHWYKLS